MVGGLEVMPTAKEKVQASYAQAAERFARSLHAVERASQVRLNELLQLLPSERIAHFADPLLTRVDALRLTRSLRSTLASRRLYCAPFPERVKAFLRRIKIGRLFSSTTLLFLTMATIYSSIAWYNTAHWTAITHPIDVKTSYSNGSTREWQMETAKYWELLRIHGDGAVLRLWSPREGYQEVTIPSKFIARPQAQSAN